MHFEASGDLNPNEVPLPQREAKEYIEVSVAVVEDNGKFLVAQRTPDKDYAGKWEFPGGKLEAGETPEESLRREVLEELGVDLKIVKPLLSLDYDYRRPDGRLFRLHSFLGRIPEGPLQLNAHTGVRWVTIEELRELDLLDSDKALLPILEEIYAKQRN